MSAALQLRDVQAAVPDGAGQRVLFERVDLDVHAGEITVVTGRSGSGKSTLLSIAALLRAPDGGEVILDGRPVPRSGERQRTRLRGRRIGIVYQHANLIPNLTALEQVQLAAHVLGRRQGAAARARQLLDRLGVGDQADTLPGRLSGGERQRVGIARALMAEPSVLLADEPTAALDADLAGQVSGLLAQLTREKGLATLIVTHDDAPLAHASQHVRLADRRLVRQAPGAVV